MLIPLNKGSESVVSAMAEDSARAWQRPSIYDVAKHAGVSHMTVSRVLNDSPNIRQSTRERVLRAIEEMNYTPSSIARALATRRTMRIGVIVDSPVQYGPNSTLRAIEAAARSEGYAIASFSISDDENLPTDTGVVELISLGVDALCVIAPRASSMLTIREQRAGLPTLVVKVDQESSMHTVAVDQYAGAVLAVSHLAELGHRNIAHVAGPLDWFDAQAREQGWREELERRGLPVRPALPGDWNSDCGYDIGRHYDLSDTTAVFAANDQMALGLIHGLAERGLSVPGDISVVGFDDVPDAAHFLPPLTTVRQDFAALGALAVRSIIAAINDEDWALHDMIEPVLVVRESTGPASSHPRRPRRGRLQSR